MKDVLVLNADFQPFKLCSWKSGLIQVIVETKEGAYPVEYYDKWVILDSSGRKYQIPAVIALKKYVKAGEKRAAYTKTNVFTRDMMNCQYCGDKFTKSELTVDHVIAKSRWKALGNKGKSTCYENIVTACIPCNSRKGSRTCQEVDMYPINKPVKASRREIFVKRLRLIKDVPFEWESYVKGLINE